MTLGGMLSTWLRQGRVVAARFLYERDPEPPWDTVDWEADPDWDWHSAAAGHP